MVSSSDTQVKTFNVVIVGSVIMWRQRAGQAKKHKKSAWFSLQLSPDGASPDKAPDGASHVLHTFEFHGQPIKQNMATFVNS